MRREDIALRAPESGRRTTLVGALERLWDMTDGGPAHILEVGSSRNTTPLAMLTDGWATRIFAWYASQTGGRVTTIDVTARAVRNARTICGEWSGVVTFVQEDARKVVPGVQADLLYMDGPADAGENLEIYRALTHRPRLILFDDIIGTGDWSGHGREPDWYNDPGTRRPWGPRGTLAIPAMQEDGYRIVFERDYQLLLEAP